MAKSRVVEDCETEHVPRSKRKASNEAPRKRGRSVLAVVLVVFVVVASAVIWRRSYGITQARALSELDRRRIQLEAERARLEGLIRDGSSRARLGTVVQSLGMRVPSDLQVRILSR